MYPYREMLCLRIESLLQAAAGDNIFLPRAVHGDVSYRITAGHICAV